MHLPFDVVVLIIEASLPAPCFGEETRPSHLRSYLSVCRNWYSVAHPLLYRHLSLATQDQAQGLLQALSLDARRARWTRTLRVGQLGYGGIDFTDKLGQVLAKLQGGQLSELWIAGLVRFDLRDLHYVPTIERLLVYNSWTVSTPSSSRVTLPYLRHLHLRQLRVNADSTTTITDLTNLPSLEALIVIEVMTDATTSIPSASPSVTFTRSHSLEGGFSAYPQASSSLVEVATNYKASYAYDFSLTTSTRHTSGGSSPSPSRAPSYFEEEETHPLFSFPPSLATLVLELTSTGISTHASLLPQLETFVKYRSARPPPNNSTPSSSPSRPTSPLSQPRSLRTLVLLLSTLTAEQRALTSLAQDLIKPCAEAGVELRVVDKWWDTDVQSREDDDFAGEFWQAVQTRERIAQERW